MGGHQADEADDADEAGGGGGEQGDQDQGLHAQPVHVDPETAGTGFPEAQAGEGPGVPVDEQGADQGDGGGDDQGIPGGAHQAAKEPEHDLLVELGGGEKLQQGEQGLEQKQQGYARQDQGLAADVAHHGQAKQEAGGKHAQDEGTGRNGNQGRQPKTAGIERQCGAKPGRGREP